MDRNEVISALQYFRDAERAVKLNERVIKNLEDQYYNSLASVQIDGMPRASGNGGSAVERTALNVPPSVHKTINDLQAENEKIVKVKGAILKEVNGLPYEQKSIVFAFYIEGWQWERISAQNHYSVRQNKRIRDKALDRLGKRFRTNKTISRFNFPKK